MDTLNKEELAVYKWQYNLYGKFYSKLFEVIAQADEKNSEKLAKGFPDEVYGYQKFANVPGWWGAVENKTEKEEG